MWLLDTTKRFLWDPCSLLVFVSDLAFVQVSGFAGAGHVSVELEKMLQQREEQLDFLLDEGMFVMQVKCLLCR